MFCISGFIRLDKIGKKKHVLNTVNQTVQRINTLIKNGPKWPRPESYRTESTQGRNDWPETTRF